MRKAIIDLGTNTFNLLIADVQPAHMRVVHSEKEGVALGMGGINKGILTDDAIKRAESTLQRFKLVCDDFEVERLLAFGTSALRDAANQKEFCEQIWKDIGIAIHIISGEEEARLIHRGISMSYAFEQPSLIMDIGGGSTEFIFADKDGIGSLQSFDVGVSRIFQHFHFSDPLSSIDIERIEHFLESKIGHFLSSRHSDILVGASGSFETFWELAYHKSFEEKIQYQEINVEKLHVILDEIISSSAMDRAMNPWIIPIRKNMAPIAAIKTKWVLKQVKPKTVIISPCSLKEGALLSDF